MLRGTLFARMGSPMSKSIGLLMFGIGVLAACGSGGDGDSSAPALNAGRGGTQGNSGTQGSSGTQGDGGSSGTQGSSGSGAAGTGIDGGSPSGDFGILSTCRKEACGSAGVHLIEDSFLQVGGDVGCILRALRNRTPGRYMYGTGATWTKRQSRGETPTRRRRRRQRDLRARIQFEHLVFGRRPGYQVRFRSGSALRAQTRELHGYLSRCSRRSSRQSAQRFRSAGLPVW